PCRFASCSHCVPSCCWAPCPPPRRWPTPRSLRALTRAGCATWSTRTATTRSPTASPGKAAPSWRSCPAAPRPSAGSRSARCSRPPRGWIATAWTAPGRWPCSRKAGGRSSAPGRSPATCCTSSSSCPTALTPPSSRPRSTSWPRSPTTRKSSSAANATSCEDERPMSYREGRFWQPDVTVATVVVDDGRLLCVEERVHGRLVLNQPAGHRAPVERVLEVALRETREGAAWDVGVTASIGAYQWTAPAGEDGSAGRHYLRFAFAAEPVAHDPALSLDDGIVRALWMAPSELRAAAERHRSPLVWRVVADYLAGQRHPLATVAQLE